MMNVITNTKLAPLVLMVFLLTGLQLEAGIKTWVASPSTNNWATAGNWGGAAPVASDRLMFQTSTVVSQYNDLTDALNLDGITFSNGASAFVFSGNSITLDGPVTNNAATTQTIKFPVTLSGDRSIVGASGNLAIRGTISGNYALTKLGAGTLSLLASNTYSGGTTSSAGTVIVQTNNALGAGPLVLSGGTISAPVNVVLPNAIVSPAGSSSVLQATQNAANGNDLYINGNISGSGNITLDFTGGAWFNGVKLGGDNSGFSGIATIGGTGNARHKFTAATAGSSNAWWNWTTSATDCGSLAFASGTIYFGAISGVGDIRNNGGGSPVMEIGGLNTNSTWSGNIGAGSGSISLRKVGAGTLMLKSANNYTLSSQLNGGVLVFSNATALSTGNIVFGGGTLKYGAGFTNDLSTRFASSTSAITIDDNGQNVSYTGVIATNNLAGLTKLGTGSMTLTATNRYLGTTTVSNGTLQINGILALSPVLVASNAVLKGSGSLLTNLTLSGGASLSQLATVGGTLALADGPALVNLQNGAANTLTVSNGLTLAKGNILNFDLATPAGSDKIALAGGSYSASGTVSINLTNLTGFGVGTYPLITGAAGIVTDNFTLASVPSASYSYSLNAAAGTLSVVVFVSSTTPTTAYWTGNSDSSWNTAANWATNQAGTQPAGAVPGDVSVVTFAADNGTHFNTTLDTNFTVKSMAYITPSNTVIAGGHTLTLLADGITVNSGAGTNTLSAPVALAANQAWNNNASNPLIMGGAVSGSGMTLTLSGSGVVQLGTPDPIDHGAFVVVSNGTFDLDGNNATVAGIQIVGNVSGSGVLTSTSAFDLRSGTVSAPLAGSVAATKTTAETVILSGANTFSGGVALNGGTLKAASVENAGVSGPFGASGSISFSGGTLRYSAVNTNDYSGRFSTTAGQAYSIDLDGGTVGFAAGLVSANGSLAISDAMGGGRLTLNSAGNNTNTMISGGTLVQGVANAVCSTNGILIVNSNATIDVNGYALGVGAMNGNGGVLLNNGGGPAMLTVGNGNALGTSGTRLADGTGVLAVSKVGSGTWTIISSNSFSGGTTLSGGGTLDVWNGNAFGTNTLTLAGGVLQNSSGSNVTIGNNFVVQSGTTSLRGVGASNGNGLTFTGNISGGGSLVMDSNASWFPYITLSGDNSGFTGTFTVNGNGQGRMRFSSTNAGSSSAVWVLNNNTDDCPIFGFTGIIKFGALSGTGGWGIRSDGPVIFEVGALNSNTTFSGTLGGNMGPRRHSRRLAQGH